MALALAPLGAVTGATTDGEAIECGMTEIFGSGALSFASVSASLNRLSCSSGYTTFLVSDLRPN